MKLSEKLSSIPSDEVVEEIAKMVDKVKVSLTNYGQRLLTVDGYEGHVTIDEFVRTYLTADAFKTRESSPTLKQRLDCYNLWEKVEKIYEEVTGR